MKGIVHIICNGQQEFWLDAENIEKVEKTFFDYRYNGSVAIVSYKDGHHDEYKGVIMVLIEHERDFIEKVEPAGFEELRHELVDMVLIPDWYDDAHYYPIFDKKLCDCDLCNRTKAILDQNNIKTVRTLCWLNKTDVLKFRNAGKKTLNELDDFLEDHGLSFGTDVDKIEKYHQEIMKRNNPK